MGAFSFVKFWKSSGNPSRQAKTSEPISGASSFVSRNLLDSDEEDLGEGDESFFDLELSVLSTKYNRDRRTAETKSLFSVPLPDHFSKDKVIPVEIRTKPKPPIGLLRSGSMLRAISFKMSKSTENPITTEIRGPSSLSFRKTASNLRLQNTDDTLSEDSQSFSSSSSSSSSKRFFSLIRPLYAEGSRNQSDREKAVFVNSQGLKVTRKHLGKNRSASPASRADESLQHDGIQNAILHCKKSFQSSSESSLLSRCSSDSSSRDKLSSTSSEDSYVYS